MNTYENTRLYNPT